jgi:hypothetical protein
MIKKLNEKHKESTPLKNTLIPLTGREKRDSPSKKGQGENSNARRE